MQFDINYTIILQHKINSLLSLSVIWQEKCNSAADSFHPIVCFKKWQHIFQWILARIAQQDVATLKFVLFCTIKNNTPKEFGESVQGNGSQYPCPAALLMFLSSVLNLGEACYQSRGAKKGKLWHNGGNLRMPSPWPSLLHLYWILNNSQDAHFSYLAFRVLNDRPSPAYGRWGEVFFLCKI